MIQARCSSTRIPSNCSIMSIDMLVTILDEPEIFVSSDKQVTSRLLLDAKLSSGLFVAQDSYIATAFNEQALKCRMLHKDYRILINVTKCMITRKSQIVPQNLLLINRIKRAYRPIKKDQDPERSHTNTSYGSDGCGSIERSMSPTPSSVDRTICDDPVMSSALPLLTTSPHPQDDNQVT